MPWSFPVATVAGIAIRVDASFFMMLAVVTAPYALFGDLPAAINKMASYGIGVCSVLLHEFGHVAAARRYGIKTHDITLWAGGGWARLERMPMEPWREIAIALAGPAVSAAICAVLVLAAGGIPPLRAAIAVFGGEGSLLALFFWINAVIFLFNLIPAFPMDGGRVLRAALAFVMPHRGATRAAAMIGRAVVALLALAVVLGFDVPISLPMLILMAVVVWLGGAAEAREDDIRATTPGLSVEDAMETRFEPLPCEATIAAAIEALKEKPQLDFPIVDAQGRILGLLTWDAIMRARNRQGHAWPVVDSMVEIPRVVRGLPLADAIEALGGAPAVAVLEPDGRYAGLLTQATVTEFLKRKR